MGDIVRIKVPLPSGRQGEGRKDKENDNVVVKCGGKSVEFSSVSHIVGWVTSSKLLTSLGLISSSAKK